jgi:AcrR family transcriptional regulator
LGKPELAGLDGSGAEARRALTRERLLSAAREVFEAQGFLTARVSDITRRAGVSHGLFYNYFESKQDIFRTLAEDVDRRLADIIHHEDPAARTPEEVWIAAIRLFLEMFRDEARILRVIEEVSRYDAELNASRRALHGGQSLRLAKAIARLQAEGRADPALDPRTTAVALGASAWRFAEQWFVWGELDCDFEHGLAQFTQIMMNALRAAPPARA